MKNRLQIIDVSPLHLTNPDNSLPPLIFKQGCEYLSFPLSQYLLIISAPSFQLITYLII